MLKCRQTFRQCAHIPVLIGFLYTILIHREKNDFIEQDMLVLGLQPAPIYQIQSGFQLLFLTLESMPYVR